MDPRLLPVVAMLKTRGVTSDSPVTIEDLAASAGIDIEAPFSYRAVAELAERAVGCPYITRTWRGDKSPTYYSAGAFVPYDSAERAKDEADLAPFMANEHARNLADIAADKLDRLASDLDALAKIERPAPAAISALAIVRDSRNEAAGALERLATAETARYEALPAGASFNPATALAAREQAADLRADRLSNRPELVRRNAAAWRAFATGAEGACSCYGPGARNLGCSVHGEV